MRTLLLVMLLCASPAIANSATASADQSPQYTYQDGILQGAQRDPFQRPSEYNPAEYNVVFKIESGGATYILTPRGDPDASKGGLLTRALIPHSVLANLPPQTPIKIRSDGRHFFVKIGDRESEYSVSRVE
jgi:hypothetical protein